MPKGTSIKVGRGPRREIIPQPKKDPAFHYHYFTEKNMSAAIDKGYVSCNLKGEEGGTQKARELHLMKIPNDAWMRTCKEKDEWNKAKSGSYRDTARKGKLMNMRDRNYSVKDGKIRED